MRITIELDTAEALDLLTKLRCEAAGDDETTRPTPDHQLDNKNASTDFPSVVDPAQLERERNPQRL